MINNLFFFESESESLTLQILKLYKLLNKFTAKLTIFKLGKKNITILNKNFNVNLKLIWSKSDSDQFIKFILPFPLAELWDGSTLISEVITVGSTGDGTYEWEGEEDLPDQICLILSNLGDLFIII